METKIFSEKARLLGLQRVMGEDNFLRNWAVELMTERLADVKSGFANILMEAHPVVDILPIWGDAVVSRRHLLLGEESAEVQVEAYDLFYNLLELHWSNDLSEDLLRCYLSLASGGLFQGCMIGGESLLYLRDCLMRAEVELSGGASMRVIPFVNMESLVGLLGSVGFGDVVVDREVLDIRYGDIYGLMRDLRWMGEGNYLLERSKKFSSRKFFDLADKIYKEEYSDDDGIIVRFELLFMHGWKI